MKMASGWRLHRAFRSSRGFHQLERRGDPHDLREIARQLESAGYERFARRPRATPRSQVQRRDLVGIPFRIMSGRRLPRHRRSRSALDSAEGGRLRVSDINAIFQNLRPAAR